MSESNVLTPNQPATNERKPWHFQPGNKAAVNRKPRPETVLKKACQAEGPDNVAALIALRDDRKIPANVRHAAIKTLLEYGFGKPSEMPQDLVQEAQELLAEEQLAQLLE